MSNTGRERECARACVRACVCESEGVLVCMREGEE